MTNNPVLGDHERRGKRYFPPLMKLDPQLLDWERVYLPEHLWIASLIRERSVGEAADIYNRACDILDEHFQPMEHEVFVGLISDFARFRPSQHDEVVGRLAQDDLAAASFTREFRNALTLYPVGPALWLGQEDEDSDGRQLVRNLITLLREQKTGKAAQCRILGLNRLLKHDKIGFTRNGIDEETIEAIKRYPNTDEEETLKVEQFARMAMNMNFQWRPRSGWPLAFWRQNLSIAPEHE